jgi:hypothetical protein
MPDILCAGDLRLTRLRIKNLSLKKETSHLGKCDASCFSCFFVFAVCYLTVILFVFVKNLPIEQWNNMEQWTLFPNTADLLTEEDLPRTMTFETIL